MVPYVTTRLQHVNKLHHEFSDALTALSFHRLFYLSAIAAPVSALHVLVLSVIHFEDPVEQRWQLGIILYHSAMVLVFGLLAWLSKPKRTPAFSPGTRRLITRTAHIALLVAGVIVTSIDQLITPAVTPFILACAVASMLFLISPLAAALLYLMLFGLYFAGMSLMQDNPVILLSNLVNGFTACSLGVGLSWILWYQNVRTLQQNLLIQQQQQTLEQKNRQLEQLATIDDLTGLANRRMLQMLTNAEQGLMKRNQSPCSLLLLDLDYFKRINDEYGHPAGDQLLQQLAELLQQSTRSSDCVARWGGEEFAIMLRDTDASHALQVAENLRQIIAEHDFALTVQDGSKQTVRMTISIGAAELDCNEAGPLDAAYRKADIALYRAKAEGRNRVCG